MYQQNITLPVESLNVDKIAATVRELVPANTQDHTTAEELRTQLRSLVERRDFHDSRAERYSQELAIVEGTLRNTKSALDEAQKLVITRPALRHRIAELEQNKERLREEITALQVAVERQAAIRDSAIKAIAEFDHSKLKRLSAEEKALG
ncbi:MAG: hypothetical protein HY010_15485 [Acidobacteria bacterium]|nr:hypothetical protein [Acidobacteriota bacterium]